MKRKTINVILSILFAVLLILPVFCFFLIEYRSGPIDSHGKTSQTIIIETDGNSVVAGHDGYVLTTKEVNFQSFFVNNFNIKPFTDSFYKLASSTFGYFQPNSRPGDYMDFNLYFLCSYMCYAFTLLVLYFVLRFFFFIPELVISKLYRRC